MRAALAVIVLALAGCGTVPGRYAEGAACTTALFLGPAVGFPLALACGLHDVHKEIAAEDAGQPAPKRKAKAPPPPPEPEADDEENDSRFSDGDDGKGNDEDGSIHV